MSGRGARGPRGSQGGGRRRLIATMFLALAVISAGLVIPSIATHGGAAFPGTRGSVAPAAGLLIQVVRTGDAEASVLGVATSLGDTVKLFVDSTLAATTTPAWNLDYWFLHVPVSNGSTVQTQIGSLTSPSVTVPARVPQPVGPPGFIYAQGSNLMLNGSPIQLFGVDDQYAFIDSMIASGLWGAPANPSYWGHNGLFPSGPDGYISGVSDANSFWREYFRYFLHYQNVSSDPNYPRPNLLRIWVADDTWYPDGTYNAWQSNPTALWALFDAMVYWAGRAGVYLVPVLGHFSDPKYNAFFDPSTAEYAHQVALAKAITSRYNDNATIAMWDLWNEPDVNDDVYWASVGGITGFKTWASTYLADVKPASSHHLLTMGIAGWDNFPGVPGFGWQYHFFFNDIPGLEVSCHHTYGTSEDQYLIDWTQAWHEGLGIPHYESETGYNAYPGPSPLGYGYWPWFTATSRADGYAAESTMVFVDNGKGPYADYPYSGPLPDYPSGGSPPPPPPPPPPPGNDTTPPANVTDLRVTGTTANSVTLQWTAPGDDGMTGNATWYDFRYTTSGPITAATFDAATHYELPFFPHPPGTTETATVPGLQTATKYWFALKTSDEVPNWSSVSNSPSAVTAPPPDVPPVAQFDFGPLQPTTNQAVSFDGTSSYDPDGRVVSYAWTFGDGATGSGPTVSHAYPSVGTYTVTLTVTDDASLTGTGSKSVTVTAPPSGGTPPSVGFSAPANGGTVSGSVTISVWATDKSGIASVSLFADSGLLGTDASSPYTWTWSTVGLKNGGHHLTAVARDPNGDAASATIDVRVRNSPRAKSVLWNAAASSVDISFSLPMNRTSVEGSVGIGPNFSYSAVWRDDENVSFVLTGPFEVGKTYVLTIGTGATDAEGVPIESTINFAFLPVPVAIPWSFYAAAGVGTFAGAIVAVLGMSRRRRHAGQRRGRD